MTEGRRDSLRDLLPAVGDELGQLEAEIDELTAKLAEKKQRRTKLRQVAHLLDPIGQPPGHGQRPSKKKAKGYSLKAAPETVDKIYDYLKANVSPDQTFSGPELVRNGFDLVSDATLNAALVQLQDQGRIRLDSLGGPGSTTRKNFKLVG